MQTSDHKLAMKETSWNKHRFQASEQNISSFSKWFKTKEGALF